MIVNSRNKRTAYSYVIA